MIRRIARALGGLPATLRRIVKRRRPTRAVFTGIYRRRAWGKEEESVSGLGSSMAHTAPVRAALPGIIAEHGVASMLDAPCGDFHWMKEVDLSSLHYIGCDIVPSLIRSVSRRHATPRAPSGPGTREFRALNIIEDPIPRVDLILCRDCLVHLSFDQIFRALANFKRSGSRLLLTTTFWEGVERNVDIVQGEWRALDLQAAPFHFPRPISLVDERGWYPQASKGLGLWRLADLPG